MKIVRVVCLSWVLLASAVLASEAGHDGWEFSCNRISCIDGISIRLRHGSVIIYPEHRRRWDDVEITEDYELYVNGEPIRLNRRQKEMVEDYYEYVHRIRREAYRIGWKGAKVGAEGAKIGVKAVAGLFRLLSSDYDTDDLERDMEREAQKIEKKAERLEDEAIEDLADELEELHEKMGREIGELRELGWF